MTRLLAATIIIGLSCQIVLSQSVTPQPYELTSRGIIAADGTERYRTAIESCYKGRPGDAPTGPEFQSCLKKQVRVQDAALNGIVRGTLNYLKNSPEQTSRFQESQRTWLQFRAANCAFARSVGASRQGQEFFDDCLLRSIVDRQAELRGLVGD